jgi:GTP cyclohydrolase I
MSNRGLADLQSSASLVAVPIDWVGVSHLRQPILVLDRSHAKQETVADLLLAVDLEASVRGAHLSRFLDILAEAENELTIRTATRLLVDMRRRLAARAARAVATFPYFIEKRAPVTGARGLLDIMTTFTFSDCGSGLDFVLEVRIPVTTLCPCSRAVSDYGAHNQRCEVTIALQCEAKDEDPDSIVWIEELVALAEAHASAPIYPALKRSDERFVTMLAYDNPAFVEDVAREIATELSSDHRILKFFVEASSDESIHNHRAFARIGSPLI